MKEDPAPPMLCRNDAENSHHEQVRQEQAFETSKTHMMKCTGRDDVRQRRSRCTENLPLQHPSMLGTNLPTIEFSCKLQGSPGLMVLCRIQDDSRDSPISNRSFAFCRIRITDDVASIQRRDETLKKWKAHPSDAAEPSSSSSSVISWLAVRHIVWESL